MPNTTITIDKLHYSFNSSRDYSIEDILLIFSINDYQIEDPKSKINNDYRVQKDVLFNDIPLGQLLLNSRFSPTLNTIKFYNKALYTNKDLVYNLIKLIDKTFVDETSVSGLEIAVDTDQNLIKKYNTLLRNDILTFHPNYISDYYGNEYKNNQFKRDENTETKYILHKKSAFTSTDNVKGNNPHLRIENKKLLLDTTIKRNYIKEYLKESKIDITNDYYRLELTIPNKELFNVSSYPIYITDNHKITKWDYDKLDEFEKLSYQKRTERKIEVIDIHELLYNKDYLYSLFYQKTRKIIFNIEKLIKIKYNLSTMQTKTKLVSKRVSAINNEDSEINKRENQIEQLKVLIEKLERTNIEIKNRNNLYQDIF